jgi:hypothetical protein
MRERRASGWSVSTTLGQQGAERLSDELDKVGRWARGLFLPIGKLQILPA